MERAKVYMTKEITPQNVIALYQALGITLPGRVAVKVHSATRILSCLLFGNRWWTR